MSTATATPTPPIDLIDGILSGLFWAVQDAWVPVSPDSTGTMGGTPAEEAAHDTALKAFEKALNVHVASLTVSAQCECQARMSPE